MTTRWLAETGGERGRAYAAEMAAKVAGGQAGHGEADLVAALAPPSSTVLDAGCGTGRVAVELARRGFLVVGVDNDPSMLAEARRVAPYLDWRDEDLADFQLGGQFDVVLAAGNVLVFVAPGTEAAVVHRLAAHLRPGGLLVTGFRLEPDGLDLAAYDGHAAAAGLALLERYATWERAAYDGGDYAVSVHQRPQ